MQDWTDIFFALLRAGLWEQDLQLPSTPSAEDWQAVLQTARQQAVLGLIYRGVAHLPGDRMPPADQRLRLLADVDRIERRNKQQSGQGTGTTQQPAENARSQKIRNTYQQRGMGV